MKKFAYILAGVAALFGFTSCDDDKEPVYTPPTEFVLNQPALADELFTLSDESVLELTCSQPDYGYSAITHYSADISLDENFTDFRNIAAGGTGTLTRMAFSGKEIAMALCELHGWASKDDYVNPGPEKIYFRAVAELNGIEGSRIVSNVVSYNRVQSYYAVLEAGRIYVVGDFGSVSWNMDAGAVQSYIEAGQVLNETGPGTNIYTGVIKFHSGVCTFRFYTELGNWGADNELPSIGANGADGVCTTVTLSSEPVQLPAVEGKGSWQTAADFEGGDVTMMFDRKNMQLTLMAGAQEVVVSQYVYMVGNQAGWKEPSADNEDVYNNWRLADSSDSGVYTGTFTMPDDMDNADLFCRFYKELSGWGAAQWAGNEEDGNNYAVTPGEVTRTVAGSGCFQLEGARGKVVTITLDTNANTIVFDIVE